MSTLNMTGIKTPVALSDIHKFEVQNRDISINVLYMDNKELVPIHTSKFCNERKHHVNLLMLTKGKAFHYVLITSLSRLVARRTKHNGATHVCPYCLHPFHLKKLLAEHQPMCKKHRPQAVEYPSEGSNILKFSKFQHQFQVPFVLYADFESFLVPNDDGTNTHTPSGFCVLTTSKFEQFDNEIYCYSGESVMENFFKYMKQREQFVRNVLSINNPMNELTTDEMTKHEQAELCSSCNEKFNTKNLKTRHHCHITGDYIAPMCQKCNLQLKYQKFDHKFFIPCFFPQWQRVRLAFNFKAFSRPESENKRHTEQYGEIHRLSNRRRTLFGQFPLFGVSSRRSRRSAAARRR